MGVVERDYPICTASDEVTEWYPIQIWGFAFYSRNISGHEERQSDRRRFTCTSAFRGKNPNKKFPKEFKCWPVVHIGLTRNENFLYQKVEILKNSFSKTKNKKLRSKKRNTRLSEYIETHFGCAFHFLFTANLEIKYYDSQAYFIQAPCALPQT